MILADAGTNCHSFVCDYVATQFDPAHLLSELGFTIVFELAQLVFFAILWKRVIEPRWFAKIHAEVDSEHGVTHHDDHIHFVAQIGSQGREEAS